MTTHARSWLVDSDYDIATFRTLVERSLRPDEVPTASRIANKIPHYDGAALAAVSRDPVRRHELLSEWAWVLGEGPGALAVAGAMGPENRVDEATEVFEQIIAEQLALNSKTGDHFAKAGSSDRVWNSHEKLAQRAPEVFAAYYSADAIALGAEAWLGPHYQISAQINRVNPGGEAQSAHRDYHVGFYAPEEMVRFPRHVHLMSQMLTLQAAVAHTDMPLESGPTMLLPFSQLCEPGYIAALLPEFQEVFAERMVQTPLMKGDLVFFNPAVMHGAGANRLEGFHRIANLLQISSAFGRTMETIDTELTSLAVYPHLAQLRDERARENVIAAACEGYAFPTNLDLDPPIAGLAPRSQADIVRSAFDEGWAVDRLTDAFADHRARQSR